MNILEESEMEKLKAVSNIIKKNQDNPDGLDVVFLDFDGVLNIPKDHQFILGESECMSHLNELCLSRNLGIVLTTSWRNFGEDYCDNYLYEHGLNKQIKVISQTPDVDWINRYNEIVAWIVEHDNLRRFVILDDIEMRTLGAFAIRCDYEYGFDHEGLINALNIIDSEALM